MERREFLKTTCSACLLAGAGLIIGSLNSCSTAAVYQTTLVQNKIVVPVSLFAETNLQIIRVKDAPYDIALRKETNGSYTALQLRCTHADNALNSTGNGFYCPLHGSKFNSEGLVTKGPDL